jgi:hypothetical protein
MNAFARAAGAAVVVLGLAASAAQGTQGCQKGTLQAFLAAQRDIQVTLYEGQRARSYIDAFNAYPPASDVVADTVALGEVSPAAPRLGLAFGKGGCLVSAGRIDRPVHEAILRAAFGQTS